MNTFHEDTLFLLSTTLSPTCFPARDQMWLTHFPKCMPPGTVLEGDKRKIRAHTVGFSRVCVQSGV